MSLTRIAALHEDGITVDSGLIPDALVSARIATIFDSWCIEKERRRVIINKRADAQFWDEQLPHNLVLCVCVQNRDFRHVAFRCPSEFVTGIHVSPEREEDDETPIVIMEQCGGTYGLEFNLHVAADGKPIDVYPFIACRPEQIEQARFGSGYFYLPKICSYFKEYASLSPPPLLIKDETKKRFQTEGTRTGKRVCIASTALEIEPDAMDVVGAFGF